MAKLIHFKKIYENNVCTDVSKLLIFIKNILLSSKKNNLFYYPEGYLFPVRWSSNYNSWVIDLGTDQQRDIKGIAMFNIDVYFKENNKYKTLLKNLLRVINTDSNIKNYYNLQKNENKFIAVYYSLENEKYYNVGLYTFAKSKCRNAPYSKNKSILLDNSVDFKNSIYNYCNLLNPNLQIKIKNYRDVYLQFYEFLKNKKYKFTSENQDIEIDLNRHIQKNTKFKYNISRQRIKEIIKNKEIQNKESTFFLENIISYLITYELYNFLLLNNFINGYVYYYDKNTQSHYLLKDSNSFFDMEEERKDKKEDFIDSKYLLMPVVL